MPTTLRSESGISVSRYCGPPRLNSTIRMRFDIQTTSAYMDLNSEQATHLVMFLNQLLKDSDAG